MIVQSQYNVICLWADNILFSVIYLHFFSDVSSIGYHICASPSKEQNNNFRSIRRRFGTLGAHQRSDWRCRAPSSMTQPEFSLLLMVSTLIGIQLLFWKCLVLLTLCKHNNGRTPLLWYGNMQRLTQLSPTLPTSSSPIHAWVSFQWFFYVPQWNEWVVGWLVLMGTI